jgi:hypothetical protein
MSEIEHFAVDFKSSDDGEIDAILIRLEDDAHTLEDVQVACKQYGVRARLFRGAEPEFVGWVEKDGTFSLGGSET